MCHDIIGRACIGLTQSQIIFNYKKRKPLTHYSQFHSFVEEKRKRRP